MHQAQWQLLKAKQAQPPTEISKQKVAKQMVAKLRDSPSTTSRGSSVKHRRPGVGGFERVPQRYIQVKSEQGHNVGHIAEGRCSSPGLFRVGVQRVC